MKTPTAPERDKQGSGWAEPLTSLGQRLALPSLWLKGDGIQAGSLLTGSQRLPDPWGREQPRVQTRKPSGLCPTPPNGPCTGSTKTTTSKAQVVPFPGAPPWSGKRPPQWTSVGPLRPASQAQGVGSHARLLGSRPRTQFSVCGPLSSLAPGPGYLGIPQARNKSPGRGAAL